MPDPNITDLAWLRRSAQTRDFSICGITHTTAPDAVMDLLGQQLIAPLQPWDAMICTSSCVKAMVEHVLASYGEYLQARFRIDETPKSPIQMPVIPLGVDCASYVLSPEIRLNFRNRLRVEMGLSEDAIVVLYFGRLSFKTKAHPAPMLIALERAAQKTGKAVSFVMAGWFPDESTKESYVEAVQKLCPSVNMLFIDGREPSIRHAVWHVADIFLSLADNIQETFGLTPIEAMAAGLPVVVSDWNGYRETVRHNVDGFLIPTWMPPPTFGNDLAISYATALCTYEQYVGTQSQCTAIDVDLCVEALVRLIENPNLRRQMGDSGQRHAMNTFDHSVRISAYVDLWQQLAEIRKSAPENARRSENGSAHPLREDPYTVFAGYPSHVARPSTRLSLSISQPGEYLKFILSTKMNHPNQVHFANANEIAAVFSTLEMHDSISINELCSALKPDQPKKLILTLSWLAKMGVIRMRSQDD